MCNQLLDTCLSKAQTFETQGLFVECATRLFNEYSGDCKKLLENLLTTIIKIQHKRKMKDGNFKNLVQMTKFKIIFDKHKRQDLNLKNQIFLILIFYLRVLRYIESFAL